MKKYSSIERVTINIPFKTYLELKTIARSEGKGLGIKRLVLKFIKDCLKHAASGGGGVKYYAVHNYGKGGKFEGYMILKNMGNGKTRKIAIVFKRRFVTFFMDLLNAELG